ncbi:hypothetical protein HA466_0277370 [Hirschfeldia incana]|nr:hypothetical protein HA466_0277370 [Hirschfeldia incana]
MEETMGGRDGDKKFKILGYQWRSLRFNDDTRQSTVKVMAAAASTASQPFSIFYMQQPHCLAVPYLKSMVSVGLTSLAASKYDMTSAAIGKNQMRILCVGHGGGSLPLFLATHILGAVVDIVEIDPVVISESVRSMGFPAFSVMTSTGGKRALPVPDVIDQVMWRGIHERLFLYESEAKDFILNNNQNNSYDLIFMDAYDGADIFPHSLWDSNSLFMKALSERLHHEHGTLVVNLHSGADISDLDRSTGKYVGKVGEAYKKGLMMENHHERNGLVFACEVPWLCNVSLVVSRGMSSVGRPRDRIKTSLMKTSLEVDKILRLPFSCLDYLKTGLAII